MMTEIDGAEFYDCSDPEQLSHDDPNDAIQDYLDLFLEPDMTAEQVLKRLPETVTVTGYKRAEVKHEMLDGALIEHAIDRLNENETLNADEPIGLDVTDEIKAAERALIDLICAAYVPWNCVPCGTIEVNTKEWIEENEPDWLKAEAQ